MRGADLAIRGEGYELLEWAEQSQERADTYMSASGEEGIGLDGRVAGEAVAGEHSYLKRIWMLDLVMRIFQVTGENEGESG